jgi:hypothetical protein
MSTISTVTPLPQPFSAVAVPAAGELAGMVAVSVMPAIGLDSGEAIGEAQAAGEPAGGVELELLWAAATPAKSSAARARTAINDLRMASSPVRANNDQMPMLSVIFACVSSLRATSLLWRCAS